MHPSTDGAADERHQYPSYIPLALPSCSMSVSRTMAPEPVERGDGADLEEPAPPAARPRRIPNAIMLVSSIVCVLTVGAGLLTRHGRRAPAVATTAATSAPAALNATAAKDVAAPAMRAPEPAAVASEPASSALTNEETARNERSEVQAALEIGDLVRAEKVGHRAVLHDATEADGWLLLVAAQIELGHVEASHDALRACAASATHGPRWECIALLQDNGP